MSGNNVGGRKREGFQRGGTVFCFDDFEALLLKRLPAQKPLHLVIIDEQNHRIAALFVHR